MVNQPPAFHESSSQETPLLGGQLTHGIVRVGNTVRRPQKHNAAFVHELLLFLEAQGWSFAPRFLGIDDQGREILSYIEGHTLPGSGHYLSDELLMQTARMIRSYHDVTAGSALAQDHEIVAHHELGPHNTIFQENQLVGLIDWDDAAPGSRLRDLANAIWCYVDVSHRSWPVQEQARRIHLMCTTYGWDDPIAIVNDIKADLLQALRNHEQAEREGAVKIFREEVSWMNIRAEQLRQALR
jgi:thiamine kinase-like enzyme